MRWLLSCSAALLALVLLLVACDTVDPNECWVNTSGGFGATGTIPDGVGVGVGGGSGDSLRLHPLGNPPANPCVTMGSDDTARPEAGRWRTSRSTSIGGRVFSRRRGPVK